MVVTSLSYALTRAPTGALTRQLPSYKRIQVTLNPSSTQDQSSIKQPYRTDLDSYEAAYLAAPRFPESFDR